MVKSQINPRCLAAEIMVSLSGYIPGVTVLHLCVGFPPTCTQDPTSLCRALYWIMVRKQHRLRGGPGLASQPLNPVTSTRRTEPRPGKSTVRNKHRESVIKMTELLKGRTERTGDLEMSPCQVPLCPCRFWALELILALGASHQAGEDQRGCPKHGWDTADCHPEQEKAKYPGLSLPPPLLPPIGWPPRKPECGSQGHGAGSAPGVRSRGRNGGGTRGEVAPGITSSAADTSQHTIKPH